MTVDTTTHEVHKEFSPENMADSPTVQTAEQQEKQE